MIRPVLTCAAAIGAWLAVGGDARGQVVNFIATLNGAQDGNTSPATGSGTFTLNAARTQLTYTVTYSGLIGGTISGAHFHAPAPPGVNAGIVRDIQAAGPGGTPNGSFTGTWSSTDATQPLTPAQVTNMLSGQMYVNVHTNDGIAPDFPGGEIRGQLVAIPEPASLALTGAAAVGALVYRRRQRKATAT